MLVRRATTRECEHLFRREIERRGHRFDRYKKRYQPARAAFSFVSCQGNNSASSSSLTTANWSAAAGDTVVAVIAMWGQTITAVKDANNTSFTVQAVVNTAGGGHVYIAYLLSVASANASYNVNVTTTGGPNELSIAAAGFTPPGSTIVSLDQTNTATGGPSAPSVSVASVTAASLVIGGTSFDNTVVETAGTNFTIPTNGLQPSNGDTATHQPCALEYWLNATGGTTTVAFGASVSTSWAIRGTSFKAVASSLLTNLDFIPGSAPPSIPGGNAVSY